MHTDDLLEQSKHLLSTLGYRSDLTLDLSGTVSDFFDEFPAPNPNTKTEQHFRDNAESAQIIFQFTKDEIVDEQQLTLLDPATFNKGNNQSFLFCAVELKNNDYSRTKYAEFTREINKRLFAPTVIIFRAREHLTIAFADRRPNITDESRDVLGQVTLIKDIRLADPHRAHLDILSELSLEQCIKWMDDNRKPQNFDGLLAAWLAKLDTEELNKQFYRKLFAWYEWAVDDEDVKFPTDENRVITREEHVIRLITRLLFIWFIKEKGLVAEELFNRHEVLELLKDDDLENGDSYYRAVLQNLFFATLNTEIDKRKFSTVGYTTNRDFSRFRYEAQMQDPDNLLALFAKTPFINGGLFDCLDTWEATGENSYRIDCFSDNQYHKLSIPNRFFFDENRGLLPLLEHYKFTVEENTPIEQEVALDPELLGRVFENLLAAYNPETGATVRKQTGSYYTPRAIVDYMVEEALMATLSQKCQPTDADENISDDKLRYLFDYTNMYDNPDKRLDGTDAERVVRAISELKILDPAVGSGAFPMGVLHKLTLALRRLDPDNTRWEALQKELAGKRAAEAFDTQDDQERREELHEIDDTFKRYRDSDFGRKLYLIQNSIFGVDIQPIACQIAKLRFFISLAIEQEPDTAAENFGIKPLPNLETRFIAANTLIGFKAQLTLKSEKAINLELELRDNREQHFHATTRQRKRKCKEKDERLRAALAAELARFGMSEDDAQKIALWDIYDQNATADWFDPEWMFGITKGFDMVIGNPPYIQLQKDGGRLADLYQPCEFDTFVRTGDIYCLFYEKGHKLLNGTGHLCFITSNKWMRAGYGKKLRDYFILYTQPVQLLDMGPDVFDATVDTNILLLQNKIIYDGVMTFRDAMIGADFDRQTGNISQYLTDNGVRMEIPAEDEPWAILSSTELSLKHKIEDVGIPLKDWDISINYGIKTGYNTAFLIDNQTKEALIAADPKSAEIIKPVLKGRDIKRYQANWAGLWLIVTHNGYANVPAIEVNNYPIVKRHLDSFYTQLQKRSDKGHTPYNLRHCAYHSAFEKEKIIYPETTHAANFFYDDGQYFIEKTCFMITGSDLKLLVGLLSSVLMTFAYKQYYGGTVLGKKGYQYNQHALEKLPVVKIPASQQQPLIALVDQILAAKQADPDADTSNLENEIDTLVYELYNLTEDEIAIVEGSV